MKLDVELARELAYGRPGEVYEGFMVVLNDLDDSDRWSLIYRLVVLNQENSTYWEAYYSVGATESQDERPFDEFYTGQDVAEFHEVEPHEVVTIEYREVS